MFEDVDLENFSVNEGKVECNNPECDYWVPEGMEYLTASHNCEEWAE